MLEAFDPQTIENEELRQTFRSLMNLVESLSAKVSAQAEEIERLRNEIRRLKGEPGKPQFQPKSTDVSSEPERKRSQPQHKSSKQAHLHIDREVVLPLDPHQLPADAVYKGHEEVIVQDLVFRTDTILFRKEKYYSPSQQRTYLADLPAGYRGQFGPGVRSWVLTLYYGGRMSEPKLLELLHTIGLHISAGQLSDLLIKEQEGFHQERAAVLEAGLHSSPWQHLDSTTTRVNGHLQQCHILCNPLYTAYATLPCKDRLSLLRVLTGGADPRFRLDALANELLAEFAVSPKWCEQLRSVLVDEYDYREDQLDALLDASLPAMGAVVRKSVKDALAIAAYHHQTSYPVVDLLLCDDAPQFHGLTRELALCWIHEYRHYKKLMPRLSHHVELLQDFGQHFWKLYEGLLQYRDHPSPAQADALRTEFEQLFASKSGYEQLDACKARTLAKKDALLMVLLHPEILLHNNPAELGARERVRKRDVSLQARTKEGIAAWDTFETLVATAKKLGVNLFHYLHDRLLGLHALPSLASLITQRAQLLGLGASWGQGP
jgi:hypothetical protein